MGTNCFLSFLHFLGFNEFPQQLHSPGPIMGQSVVELAAQDLHHLGPCLGCDAAEPQGLSLTPVF